MRAAEREAIPQPNQISSISHMTMCETVYESVAKCRIVTSTKNLIISPITSFLCQTFDLRCYKNRISGISKRIKNETVEIVKPRNAYSL